MLTFFSERFKWIGPLRLFGHKWYDIWAGALLLLLIADYFLFYSSPVWMTRMTFTWMALDSSASWRTLSLP